jgi:hypothetical protein
MRISAAAVVLALLVSVMVCAENSAMPKNHPAVPPAENRQKASELTEKLRPSGNVTSNIPVPIKNLIDEHIFRRMEQDHIPHAICFTAGFTTISISIALTT